MDEVKNKTKNVIMLCATVFVFILYFEQLLVLLALVDLLALSVNNTNNNNNSEFI